MSPHRKLVTGTVVVALLAGGGAALAAIELTSSSDTPAAAPTTASFGASLGGYGFGDGRMGGRGLGGGLGFSGNGGTNDFAGPRLGRGRMLASGIVAAAAYLGIPANTIRKDLAAGQTFAQVATAQGKTADGLVAALVAAEKKTVAQDVQNGRLTQAQAQELEGNLDTRVTELVNGTLRGGRFGGGRGRGGPNGGPGDGSGANSGGTGSFGNTATT